MTETKETKQPKKPYVRPEIEQVRLDVTESVLTSCKLARSGPSGPHCNPGHCNRHDATS